MHTHTNAKVTNTQLVSCVSSSWDYDLLQRFQPRSIISIVAVGWELKGCCAPSLIHNTHTHTLLSWVATGGRVQSHTAHLRAVKSWRATAPTPWRCALCSSSPGVAWRRWAAAGGRLLDNRCSRHGNTFFGCLHFINRCVMYFLLIEFMTHISSLRQG